MEQAQLSNFLHLITKVYLIELFAYFFFLCYSSSKINISGCKNYLLQYNQAVCVRSTDINMQYLKFNFGVVAYFTGKITATPFI